MKSDFLNEIESRGFIYQSSEIDELDKLMCKKSIAGYIGFDSTSDSLHIGSLVQLMLLYWMQHYDHKPIALMGGGTTLVGDPSGKNQSRKILSKNEIEKNIKKIESTFKYFIDFKKGAKIINNYKWLADLNYINFLRDIGQKVTINKMITFDSVKSRLDKEDPLSFLEFNYMLLQAYDFLHLNKKYDCVLQLGGSDQWGNILMGIDLIKKINNKKAFAITSPLITLNDGSKMGKTVDGAIWLDKKKLDDFTFFQYWRNINDEDVPKFLKLFTTLPLSEIKKLSKLKGQEINEAKKILSFEITKLCRGLKSAQKAEEITENIFDKKIIDERLNLLEVKHKNIDESNFNILDALSNLNFVKSKSEAKRLIKAKGVKVNDTTYNKDNFSLADFSTQNKEIKISVGKNKIGIIRII